MGGKLHLKLNTGTRRIANKYREGKKPVATVRRKVSLGKWSTKYLQDQTC